MITRLFAAIDVGSYEVNMKIFEFSTRNRMREIENVRYSIDLGTDSFGVGKISMDKINELCKVLKEFKDIMNTYHVTEYKAYGTSAIRESENTVMLLDQIEVRTGIKVEVISNSEQRYIDYKSVATRTEDFNKIIEKGTAIVDIGGGSIQISLFDRDTLVATQNLRLGVLRMLERLEKMNIAPGKLEYVLDEMIGAQIAVFKKLYLKDREIEHVIVVDDYVSDVLIHKVEGSEEGYLSEKNFEKFLNVLRTQSPDKIAKTYDMTERNIKVMTISAMLIRRVMKAMEANLIWAPGVALCDGIAYEYGEKNKLITYAHDFEADIVACSKNISKRYLGSKKRGETLENLTLTIFDSMKKIHGLGKRERFLLRIAAILHDCGKYISMINLGICSYNIIMSTEIIGLSHEERKMVAHVVKYNHMPFEYFDEFDRSTNVDSESYKVIAKLAAILKLANGLDRSHKQKFKDIKTTLRENELIITVNYDEDITLETGLLVARADFFEEVFSIRPVIKQRKTRAI